MTNFIYDFFIITIIGGVIVGLILLAFKKFDFKTIFLISRITRLLKKYEKIKLINKEMEKSLVKKFGQLLDNGHNKVIDLGFSIIHNDNTINNDLFGIHLTRVGQTNIIDKFLLRRLENGQIKKPDEVYFSEKYPESQKENNDTSVLYDFIEYLKSKKKILRLLKFLKIKK